MKKVILSSIFAVALLATAGWGVNKSMGNDANLSDLALANVEALAFDEGGGNVGEIPCYGTIRIDLNDPDIYEPIWAITLCNGCELVNCYEYRDGGLCTRGGFILV